MEILNTPIKNSTSTASTSQPPRVNQPESFSDVLTGQIKKTRPQQSQTTSAEPILLVGKITSETQTVSELLMQHKQLKESTWNILDKEQNKNKDFTRIRPGTSIYYNKEDGILTWAATPLKPSPPSVALPSTNSHPPFVDPSIQNSNQTSPPERINHAHPADFNVAPAAARTRVYPPAEAKPLIPGNEYSIKLGRLDSSNTTVSHLLTNHPKLREDAWNLLSSSINRGKPFHRLARGTEIFLNTENMEITWNSGRVTQAISHLAVLTAPETLHRNSAAQHPGSPAANLSEAVKPYLGIQYKELNCYELLVKGLQAMDIPYKGKDGLYTKLTRMAQDRGMAENAFLTGEGIIEAAGSLVLSKNYPDIENWKNQAAALMREIKPLLNSGQILSFSTDTKGHTGIVSQQNYQWTFINSGRLDNSVEPDSVYRGVGEEVLHKEIRNWFKLAHAKRETLNITLGRLEQNTILTASTTSESSLKPI